MYDQITRGIMNVINNLNSDFTTKERALLKRLGQDVSIGCIVAIGTSSVSIVNELKSSISECEKKRLTPNFFYFKPGDFSEANFDSQNSEDSNIRFSGTSYFPLSSEVAASFWRKPIGLLLLTSNISFEQLKREFDQWKLFVVPNGIIVVYDKERTSKSTRKMIEEIVSTKKYIQCDHTGRITVLRKVHVTCLYKIPPRPQMHLLIACHDITLAGGLLRFQRAGRVWKKWGHKVYFVVFSNAPKLQFESDFPVISLEQAKKMYWDAVIVPGAGFPKKTIEQFAELKRINFGIRVQNILNDQSKLKRFKQVNEAFSPNIIIFNNTYWPVGSFTRFQADRFHFLIGAVDLQVFSPLTYRTHPLTPNRWVVGGLAQKNPDPLVESLAHLPEMVHIRMFGRDTYKLSLRYKDFIDQGRLDLVGILDEHELKDFYQSVDCVVMTEKNAGWANMVAEAMASGVPVICTPNGTSAFARNNKTALIIDNLTPSAIAERVELLMNDEQLCHSLAESAYKVITDQGRYSWEEYANCYLRLIRHDGQRHYTYAPELGIYGKWPLGERVKDLYPLLEKAKGLSILDFGAAEGVVAREFLKMGAVKVHGFELDPYRVAIANAICSGWKDVVFRNANLSKWESFYQTHKELMDDQYDIVLYLGLHHHLPKDQRKNIFKHVLSFARQYFAIRTTETVYVDDEIENTLTEYGFRRLQFTLMEHPDHLGVSRIYKKG